MARARNIKPSFFTNDELSELDPLARLLFIGMWTIADFKGCFEYKPKRLKVQLLPYDDCDIEKLAINLDKSGFISIYSVRDQLYAKVMILISIKTLIRMRGIRVVIFLIFIVQTFLLRKSYKRQWFTKYRD